MCIVDYHIMINLLVNPKKLIFFKYRQFLIFKFFLFNHTIGDYYRKRKTKKEKQKIDTKPITKIHERLREYYRNIAGR